MYLAHLDDGVTPIEDIVRGLKPAAIDKRGFENSSVLSFSHDGRKEPRHAGSIEQ